MLSKTGHFKWTTPNNTVVVFDTYVVEEMIEKQDMYLTAFNITKYCPSDDGHVYTQLNTNLTN